MHLYIGIVISYKLDDYYSNKYLNQFDQRIWSLIQQKNPILYKKLQMLSIPGFNSS